MQDNGLPLPPKLRVWNSSETKKNSGSDEWSSIYSSYDTTPRYPGKRSSLASISMQNGEKGEKGNYFFTIDPREFHPSKYGPESDDEDFLPLTKLQSVQKTRSVCCSLRGLGNVVSLFVLIGGLVSLFVGYPVATFFGKPQPSTLGGFNVGGINASGQIPRIAGNFGLIDEDTPKSAYTRPSWRYPGEEMQLVFSDEFNQDGRSFYPGDDPYWEAVDLHYWATGNIEWYDPQAVTTRGGALEITLSQKQTHGLNYQGGMISSWNKFCFTGGYMEVSVTMPGPNNILGLWPAIWTMGNLGRAGYGATLEGTWPYSYDACDVGTLANQTLGGLPLAATMNGDPTRGGSLSYLPGQKLSRCTCPGQDHPGPKHPDGTFVGRAAPEIDIFEATINPQTLLGEVSQSAQWAPFNAEYRWNTAGGMVIRDPAVSIENTYVGGATQQSTSVLSVTDQDCYESGGTGCYSIYGFEYRPGFDNAYITWISDNSVSWTMLATGVGPDTLTEISGRPVSQEPMYMIVNLGMSRGFGAVDLEHLPFPVTMRVDYVRVYQPTNAINWGCSPKNFPTDEYIKTHIEAYTNSNLTTWVDDYQQPWPLNSLIDQC